MNGSFSMSIGNFSRETLERQDKVRRAVILKLFNSVILDTPVLSGRLRASWRCSVGEPDRSQEPEGKNSKPNASLEQVGKIATTSEPTDVAILSNSLPYASRIEYEGWSHTKAPQGMVRRNVARFRQLLSSEVHRLS